MRTGWCVRSFLQAAGLRAGLLSMLAATTWPVAAAEVFFEDRVGPLLGQRCRDCHGAKTRRANLDLSSAEGVRRGADSGPVIQAGDPARSRLYEMVHSGEMPRKGDKLTSEEMGWIEEWIREGARFRSEPVAGARLHKHDVLPILLLRCSACHGAELQRGDLDLRRPENLLSGGKSGPAILPGQPDSSLALQRVEQELCPPKDQLLKYFVERPAPGEVDRLREWIAGGASMKETPPDAADGRPDPLVTDADRAHWAFQKLPAHVAVPEAQGPVPLRPVDAFVQVRQRENGLEFAPEASRATLIRRVHFDLIGLPPTPEELARWREHPSDGWYAEMVDHLLASPHYGERWGRFWLDVAGYADSEGGTSEDPVRETAWKYRDYVIRSLNADKPWDRFLTEQLAGDEIAPHADSARVDDRVVEQLIATGFLRMGVDQTGSRTMNFVPERLGVIADALQVVGSGLLGLTLDCARCHSHKYDAIPQRDYYRLKAVFQGALDEHDWLTWKTRNLEVAPTEVRASHDQASAALQKQIKAVEMRRAATLKSVQDRYYRERWPQVAKAEQDAILAALKADAGRRSRSEEERVRRYETELKPVERVLVERHPELGVQLRACDAELVTLRGRLPPPLAVRALWDRGRPSPTYLLSRGEAHRPTRLVGPGVPSVLTDGRSPFIAEPPWPGADKTGRRLAFARWLTQPDHPLTARVLVNRVWAKYFGRGLVATLDNFGVQGARPTHPELLDWMARDFVDSGWSLKHLHRTLLLSRTYRQSSQAGEAAEADPENLLLTRMALRRLDAEALRDAMHAVAGRLTAHLHGPPSPVSVRADGLIMEDPAADGSGHRRSVYLRLRRTEMPSLLATFDYPEMQPNCIQRSISTVSLQPLMLLNNSRVRELAAAFADRLLAAPEDSDVIRRAFEAALQRPPDPEEQVAAQETLQKARAAWIDSGLSAGSARRQALAALCHTLFNTAEFLHVD